MEGAKSFAPLQKACSAVFILPKFFCPMMNAPTTKLSAISTIPMPKSAIKGTAEATKITPKTVKNRVKTCFAFCP